MNPGIKLPGSDDLLQRLTRYYFDRPVMDPDGWMQQWHNAEASAVYPDYLHQPDGARVDIALHTRLFADCAMLGSRYSDLQLNAGLWEVIGSGTLGSSLFAAAVPLEEKTACIAAIDTVYTALFVPRCVPALGHQLKAGDQLPAPLNSICYMWWDLFPTWGRGGCRDAAALDAAVLRLLERLLTLAHDACRESALHGLGHWQLHYPAAVRRIIDEFLARTPQLTPDLHAYARRARSGAVQ